VVDFSKSQHPLIKWFRRAALWPALPWMLMVVVIIDFFVMFLPGDACLAVAILGNPRRTRRFWSAMVVGRMLAVALAFWGSRYISLPEIQQYAAQLGMTGPWARCESFFQSYGAGSVALVALSPLPMLFVTLLAAMAGTSLTWLLISAGAGTAVRYLIIAALVLAGMKMWPDGGQHSKTSAHPKTGP
jgi:membrane protein YqaA with SNARE-associated domain